jgi:hypothetical protein
MIRHLAIVIPGRPAEARRAKADEPGIQKQTLCLHLDSGFRPSAGPGMTENP